MAGDIDLDAIAAKGWLRKIVHERSVDSTNSRAMDLLASGNCELPLLVLADEQTAGRGRGSNRWWSSRGSITLSLAVSRTELRLTPQSLYSLAVAVAVRDVLAAFIDSARIGLKWPNDVLLDGKKAAGILLETGGPSASALIVGMGVNANNDFAGAPVDVRARATSVAEISGQPVSQTGLISDIVVELQNTFTRLNSGDGILTRYRRADYLLGRRVRIHQDGEGVEGECAGIADSGELVLVTANGRISLASGSVEMLVD